MLVTSFAHNGLVFTRSYSGNLQLHVYNSNDTLSNNHDTSIEYPKVMSILKHRELKRVYMLTCLFQLWNNVE